MGIKYVKTGGKKTVTVSGKPGNMNAFVFGGTKKKKR